MRNKPKQSIRRGVVEVRLKNGSQENAVYSWDVTDEQAAREGRAINRLNTMRPDMSTSNNNVTQQDKLHKQVYCY